MTVGDFTDTYAGDKHDPALAVGPDMRHELDKSAHAVEPPPLFDGQAVLQSDEIDDDIPTEEELKTLRRVADHIPARAYTIAFVELVERFSFYGTVIVCTCTKEASIPCVLY